MSIVNTRLLGLRAMANLDKYEIRPTSLGAFNLFATQTDSLNSIISPGLKEKAFGSIDNTLQVPVYDAETVTIGSTRTATIADSENTSQLVTISFTPYTFGFTMLKSMYDNNEFSYQHDFNQKLKKYLDELGRVLDTAAITALEAGRSQVFNNILLYENHGNTVSATWALREDIIGDLGPLNRANDYSGMMDVVGNSGVESIVRKLAQSSIYNAENKQLQFSDKILHWTERITNPQGRYATGYAIQPGSLGLLYRFERDCINGVVTKDGHEFGITTLPGLNIPIGTYYYDGVGDHNALGGASTASFTRGAMEYFGFAVDIAFVTPYNSSPSTIPSSIVKFSINRAATDADAVAPAVASVVSAAKTAAVITFSEALCSDDDGTLLTGDVSSYITEPATGSTTCLITTATADATGKIWTLVIVAGDVAATDTFDLALPVYDANGNALVATTKICEMNAGATAWEAV